MTANNNSSYYILDTIDRIPNVHIYLFSLLYFLSTKLHSTSIYCMYFLLYICV